MAPTPCNADSVRRFIVEAAAFHDGWRRQKERDTVAVRDRRGAFRHLCAAAPMTHFRRGGRGMPGQFDATYCSPRSKRAQK